MHHAGTHSKTMITSLHVYEEEKSKEKYNQTNRCNEKHSRHKLCDILQEGLMTYFKGECMTSAMLRIRGMGRGWKGMVL
jgi:hypothetical protein